MTKYYFIALYRDAMPAKNKKLLDNTIKADECKRSKLIRNKVN